MGRANLLHDIYFQTCKKTYSLQQYDSVLVVAKCSRDLLFKKVAFIFFQVHYLVFALRDGPGRQHTTHTFEIYQC